MKSKEKDSCRNSYQTLKMFDFSCDKSYKYDVDVILFFEFCEDSIHYPLTYEMMRDNKDLPPVPKYVFVNTSSGIKRVQNISKLNNYLKKLIIKDDQFSYNSFL